MGALAGLLKAAGHDVRGSDNVLYPPMSDQLQDLNIPVFNGFSAKNMDWGPDQVVVGNVCRKDHVEVQAATAQNLPLTSLPAVLSAEFLNDKHSIVVAGSHGKTTTSSLLASILTTAGRDPGCFVGGVPIAFGRGWRVAGGAEFVVEGDEYDTAFFDKGSKFLHYQPRTAILTTVELDHVDIFESLEAVRATFRKFVRLLPEDGLLVVSAASKDAVAIAESEARCPVETYAVDRGGDQVVDAQWIAKNLEATPAGRCRFELWRSGELIDRYETLLVGAHNVGNAVAAIAVAHSLGVPPPDIRRGAAQFAGVKRRQEIRGLAQGVYVLDDYAHHPTAVMETLKALRKRFPGQRVLAIYEPRSATARRKTFQAEYVEAFVHADRVVIGRPYDLSTIPAEQRLDPEKLALDVHRRGTQAGYVDDVSDIVKHAQDYLRPGDVVVIMSSGAFDGLHDKLLAGLGDAITPAVPADMATLKNMLREADVETFPSDESSQFMVLKNEKGLVGCVALEVFGEDAVLRSLAVAKDARGVGYGWMLADTAISSARHRGVKRIYLLTASASDFFAVKHGFRVVDSSTIAPEIAESPTFHNAGDAVAMRLDL